MSFQIIRLVSIYGDAMNRREFGLATLAMGASQCARAQAAELPEAIQRLRPMTEGIQSITDAERNARIEKARRLMRENRIDAIFLEGASEHVLLHRHSLGRKRAHVRLGAAGAR
jgi:hypothetical protein